MTSTRWSIEVSLSLNNESETVYPVLCDSLTWTLDSSNVHVCMRPRRTSDCFLMHRI